jgi:L-alanine-DL-glutamate epimerase-like enolase superfamily enzyme
MRIASIECLSAYAGWRIHDFLKVTMADGLVGWSEFSRALNGPGVIEAISVIARTVIGEDPRAARVRTTLLAAGRASTIAHQACAAIANALLDVRARALNVSVIELLGGRVRDRVPVYWAHCGTYRTSHAELMRKPPLRTLDDVVHLGHEVVDEGFAAFKTNLLLFADGQARRYAPRASAEAPRLTTTPALASALVDQLTAFRDGAGDDVDMMVDLGSNFRAPAALSMAQAIEPLRPAWIEVEFGDIAALRYVREHTRVPVAGGERLRAAEYHALLRERAVDVPIVDVLFNGVAEALHVADACQAYELNVAVHNCYSPLATLIGTAFAAVAPNLQLLELDVDAVPWQNDFVTCPPRVLDGFIVVPEGPGWGAEVDEAAVREHPVPRE